MFFLQLNQDFARYTVVLLHCRVLLMKLHMLIEDLRAVSILPVLSKIIEKVIALQLMEYIECKHILPDVQSSFRKKQLLHCSFTNYR
nr:unnamed protein product [Callosobruchus analis]